MIVNAEDVIRAGHIISVTGGEYSSFRVMGHLLALQDIPRALIDEIAAEANARAPRLTAHDYFLAAFIRKGLVVAITVDNIHLGGDEMEVDFGPCNDFQARHDQAISRFRTE